MIVDRITDLNYRQIRRKIISFLKKELAVSGTNGYVLGLSGGLDSSVVAMLAAEAIGEKLHVLILPNARVTPMEDIDDAIALCERLKIGYNMIDLGQLHSSFVRKVKKHDKVATGNLLARLRMCVLYYYANSDNLLVLGTSDKSELLMGYFTKFGDGAADVLPIASLYKLQVKALGKYIGLPDAIIQKKIGPRLWKEHTAEAEIGMTYDQIDSILYYLFELKYSTRRTAKKLDMPLGNVLSIKTMYEKNQHKRYMPKICEL